MKTSPRNAADLAVRDCYFHQAALGSYPAKIGLQEGGYMCWIARSLKSIKVVFDQQSKFAQETQLIGRWLQQPIHQVLPIRVNSRTNEREFSRCSIVSTANNYVAGPHRESQHSENPDWH